MERCQEPSSMADRVDFPWGKASRPSGRRIRPCVEALIEPSSLGYLLSTFWGEVNFKACFL